MTSEISTGEDGQRGGEASQLAHSLVIQLACSLEIQLISLQFGDSVN